MKRFWLGLVSGLLFGAGLCGSGMTSPEKVIGFLDFFGRWEPSLLWVMVGAIAVHLPMHRLVRRLPASLTGAPFPLPTKTAIDARLLLGASIFGVGWGLGGFCPGPAIASAFDGLRGAFAVTFTLLGVWLFELVAAARGRQAGGRASRASKPNSAVCA